MASKPAAPRARILFVLTLMLVFQAIGATMLGPSLTSIEHDFDAGHRALGLTLAMGSLGYVAGVKIAGAIAARAGLAAVVRYGVWMMAAGLLGIAGGPFLWILPVSHFLFGVGAGLSEMASVSAIQSLYPERRRASLNLFQVGFGLGAIAGPALAQLTFRLDWSWRWNFVAPALPLIPLVFALAPRDRFALEGGEHARPSDPGGPLPLRNPSLWLCFLALLFYVGAEWGVSSFSSAHFEGFLGASKANAALAPMAMWAGILLGRVAMWFVADRVSGRRIVIGSAVAGGGLAAMAVATRSLPLALLFLFLSGIAQAPLWPTVVDHASRRLRTHSPRVLSVVILGGGVGGLGQALVGAVAQARSLTTGLVVALLFFAGVVAAMLVDRWVELREGRRQA